jgi:hypothetical protein
MTAAIIAAMLLHTRDTLLTTSAVWWHRRTTVKTYDIWLEDSTGRQYRRSNHYLESDMFQMNKNWNQYLRMMYQLAEQGITVVIKCKQFCNVRLSLRIY